MSAESKIRSRLLLILASLLVAFFLLLFAEVALRMAGFRFDTRPRYMEFNYPNPRELHEIFEPDPATLWRLKPGTKMGPGIEAINSMGCRGPEFEINKPAGVKRVVALGDSVTFGAAVGYPNALAECLGKSYEVINAGVPGFSVFQGLKLFESRIAQLKPDIVTVMFGWNDHWIAKGYPDSQQQLVVPAELPATLAFVTRLRIFQLTHYMAVRLGGSRREDATPVNRAPIEEYRLLLEKLIDKVEKSGARPILITPPSALDSGKVPDYIFDIGFMRRIKGESEKDKAQRLKRLHASYNDIVRELAAKKGVTLVDLESQWYELGTAKLFRDPSRDVVHPNEEGYRLIGKILCDTIKPVQ